MSLDFKDKQGGKRYGALRKKQEDELDEVNRDFLDGDTYKDVEDLEEKLNEYKEKFMEYDLDNSGDIDIME